MVTNENYVYHNKEKACLLELVNKLIRLLNEGIFIAIEISNIYFFLLLNFRVFCIKVRAHELNFLYK